MSTTRLKLTALSPIHIGSGEIYEPNNFIIDKNILYEFRDEDFFDALPQIKREAFLNIIEENRADSFVRIHSFIKENREFAKKIAKIKVAVTKGVQKEYDKRVGRVSQFEGKNKKVFNRFEIQKIQRKQIETKNGYFYSGYLVGSSLKGAISTAYQEYIYKKEGKEALREKFQSKGRDIDKNIFKDFKVSDSIVTKIATKIGFALNKERFEYDFDNSQNNLKLSTLIETISPTSEFIVNINHNNLNIKEILQSCNSHYLPIFKSLFLPEINGKEEFINEYLEDKFYEAYRHFEAKSNKYLIRVGKHSGARAVTIDGLREIQSKVSGGGARRKPNKWQTLKEESTTWLFGDDTNKNNNLLPFGWFLCEII